MTLYDYGSWSHEVTRRLWDKVEDALQDAMVRRHCETAL